MSALDLARLQFGFVVSFHIIFRAFSIGLASYLAALEGLATFNYWLKIFAVIFGIGVVMSYQFGTNWSIFSDKTGPVIGPLMDWSGISGKAKHNQHSSMVALRHVVPNVVLLRLWKRSSD